MTDGLVDGSQAQFLAVNFSQTDSPPTPDVGVSAFVANDGTMKLINSAAQIAAIAANLSAVVLLETKAEGVDGGSITPDTWQTRQLNEMQGDTSLVNLSSYQFTPVAGTYLVYGYATGYQIIRNQVRVFNVTQATEVITGTSGYFGSGHQMTGRALAMGVLTVNGSDAFAFQHQATDNYGGNSLGAAIGNTGLTVVKELYAALLLLKLSS